MAIVDDKLFNQLVLTKDQDNHAIISLLTEIKNSLLRIEKELEMGNIDGTAHF